MFKSTLSTWLAIYCVSNFLTIAVCKSAPNCKDEEGILSYSLFLYEIECQHWDKTKEVWNAMPCKVFISILLWMSLRNGCDERSNMMFKTIPIGYSSL